MILLVYVGSIQWSNRLHKCNEEYRSRNRHNVECFLRRCTIFRLAKPAFCTWIVPEEGWFGLPKYSAQLMNVSCSTSTPKNHIFLQNTSCIQKATTGHLGGGSVYPLHPLPRLAHVTGFLLRTHTKDMCWTDAKLSEYPLHFRIFATAQRYHGVHESVSCHLEN